jgi:hypothetical protein
VSGTEDTGSRSVSDAAAFERYRARNYDPPEDDGEQLADGPPQPRYVRGYRVPTRCTCNARSEEPCDFCAGGWEG